MKKESKEIGIGYIFYILGSDEITKYKVIHLLDDELCIIEDIRSRGIKKEYIQTVKMHETDLKKAQQCILANERKRFEAIKETIHLLDGKVYQDVEDLYFDDDLPF